MSKEKLRQGILSHCGSLLPSESTICKLSYKQRGKKCKTWPLSALRMHVSNSIKRLCDHNTKRVKRFTQATSRQRPSIAKERLPLCYDNSSDADDNRMRTTYITQANKFKNGISTISTIRCLIRKSLFHSTSTTTVSSHPTQVLSIYTGQTLTTRLASDSVQTHFSWSSCCCVQVSSN